MHTYFAWEPGAERPAVEILDHVVAVRPSGEIDLASAPSLRLALDEALALALAPGTAPARADAPLARRIVVDCSRVTFCDSSGLDALLAARLTAAENGIVIHLVAPGRQFRRLLDLTGTLPLFPVERP